MRTRSGKGWGQLPREIAKALAGAKINGSESRILWAMVYKTIAFNKENDGIPWSQLEELTGIDQWHIGRAINSLLKKGLIYRKDSKVGIQRDLSKWEIPPKQVVNKELPPKRGEIPPNQGELPPNQVDSRDLSKRTIQERVFSKPKEERKIGEVPQGLKDAIEKIGHSMDKKKENYRLRKKK